MQKLLASLRSGHAVLKLPASLRSGHAVQKLPASLQRIKAEAAAARRTQEAVGYTEVCTPDPRVMHRVCS